MEDAQDTQNGRQEAKDRLTGTVTLRGMERRGVHRKSQRSGGHMQSQVEGMVGPRESWAGVDGRSSPEGLNMQRGKVGPAPGTESKLNCAKKWIGDSQ